MGAYKQYAIAYSDRKHKTFDDLTENDYFGVEVDMVLDTEKNYDEEIAEFLDILLPEQPRCKYWIMVSNHEKSYANYSFKTKLDMIQACSVLSRKKYNLFFSSAGYNGWRDDEHARYSRAVFVDIDDLDVDFSQSASSEIADWLISNYDLPEELLPNLLVSSGHGLHLYYLIDEIDTYDFDDWLLKRQYTRYLINYFKGDIHCQNDSRVLRIPNSYNVKYINEERKTKLHKLNLSEDRDIKRLDYFQAPREEIDKYIRECQEKINEKARQTREANKANPKVLNATQNDTKAFKIEWDIDAVKRAEEQEAKAKLLPYYTDYDKHARAWNIIKDLNNFYRRHQGHIEGFRNVFFMIMAVYLKCVMPLEEALKFINRYATLDFREEAIITVTKIYEKEKIYRFRNVTIAELLAFSKEDIEQSYCNFSEERAKERRKKALKESNRNLAERRKAERNTAEYKEMMYANVCNSTLKVKELADYWGVSESTIKRIRRKYRNSKS